MLSIAFSLVANAESITTKSYYVYTNGIAQTSGGSYTLATGIQYPKDGKRQTFSGSATVNAPTSGNRFSIEMYLAHTDKTVIYSQGDIITGRLENIYFQGTAKTSVATYNINLDKVSMYLLNADGTSQTVTATLTKDRNGYYMVNFNFTANKDVSQLYFILYYNMPSLTNGVSVTYNITCGEPSTTTESNDNLEFSWLESSRESEESGWLAKVWQKLSSGFTSVVDSITQLPNKLWTAIEDGLKGLFVPDEQYIVQSKENWSALMEDRLGAVWQVVTITYEAWDNIDSSDENNTVDMPEVTIPLPEGESFSFGGYTVKIVPEGFEGIVVSLKLIAGIVCTFMFINGLRKRYDEVMGVEK